MKVYLLLMKRRMEPQESARRKKDRNAKRPECSFHNNITDVCSIKSSLLLLSEILFPITFGDEISPTDSMQVYPEWKSNPQKISRTIHLQDQKLAAKHLQSSASRPIDDGNIL